MFLIGPERLLLLAVMFGCDALDKPLNMTDADEEEGFGFNGTLSYNNGFSFLDSSVFNSNDSGMTNISDYYDESSYVHAEYNVSEWEDGSRKNDTPRDPLQVHFEKPVMVRLLIRGVSYLKRRRAHDLGETVNSDPFEFEVFSVEPDDINKTFNNQDKISVIQHINSKVLVIRANKSSVVHSYLYNSSREGLSEKARQFLTGSLSTIIIPSFYTLVCLFSLPINICALLVLIRRIRPKKPAVICMMNLACADLLFSMVLPFKISYHFNRNNWIFGPAMCRIVTAVFYWNMYCSVLLIALISMDRLLAVVYPIKSMSWRSPAKAVIACAAMWILSFAGTMHLLFTEQTFNLTELNITTCHDIQPSKPFWGYKPYFITLCFLLFFLPLIITMASYTRVIFTLSKVQPGVPDRSQKKRRAVFLTATVLVMFVVCFTPTNLILLTHQLMYYEGAEAQEYREKTDNIFVLYVVFLCLGSLNCLLDPLVYFFGSSHFQKELSSMLLKLQKTPESTQTVPSTKQT